MALTPAQLKNRLVQYYIASWRSNAVAVTHQEMLNSTMQFNTGQDLLQTTRDIYLHTSNPDQYLRLRCDASAPADADLRSQFLDLRVLAGQNPATVRAMAPLLDEEIQQHGLEMFLGERKLAELNTNSKVLPPITVFICFV
jgi:hypothetical protein